MKSPDRNSVSKLDALPNIGMVISADLVSIGINEPKNLIGKDPFKLYEKLCIKKGQKVDLCVIDVFISAVEFMEGANAQPWWNYTSKRKQMLG